MCCPSAASYCPGSVSSVALVGRHSPLRWVRQEAGKSGLTVRRELELEIHCYAVGY